MIEERLAAWAGFSMRHSRMVLVAGLLAATSWLYVARLPMDLSFAGIMDRTHPEVARYFAASERYGLGGALPLLLEGPEGQLDQAALAVELRLDEMDEVESVLLPPPRRYFELRSPWLVERREFEAWMALGEAEGVDVERSRGVMSGLEALAAERFPPSPEGARLITLVMSADTFEMALDSDAYPAIRRAVGEVVAPLGVSARFAGMPAIITQEQEATLERLRVLGPLSLLLVLAILLAVERRPLMLLSIAVPMLLAVGCTLALVGALEGRLTLMESVFGVIVFGLGVDFAIHLLLRLREERSRGRGFEPSMGAAMAGTGRGVLAGGVTTAGAFLVLALAPDPVFARLGLAGGLGLLFCLLFLLGMLPALWQWIDRRSPEPVRSRWGPGARWLARWADAAARSPGKVLVGAGLVVALAAVAATGLRYETNLERVFSRDIEAVETAREIRALFGVDPGPWLIPTPDLAAARRVSRALEADPIFARAESLASLIPADVEERRSRLAATAPALARTIRQRESAAREAEPNRARLLRESVEPLALLLAAHTAGPPRIDGLPAALAERWIGPEGELLVYAYAADPALDSAVAARERQVAQAVDPNATSMSAIYEALIGTDRPWMPPIVAGVLVFVAAIVLIDLRSLRLAVLALLPVLASSVATVGLLTILGFSFNTVTLVAIPVLLGLGVDDGIHVVHRMIESREASIGRAVASVGRSIALTTATTCGSVALLLFTRHPGVESVAVLLLVGLPMALLATIVLVPAAASALRLPGAAAPSEVS